MPGLVGPSTFKPSSRQHLTVSLCAVKSSPALTLLPASYKDPYSDTEGLAG